LADAISEAFSNVLGKLSPTERAVFLLREAFDLDYEDIASVVDRSEANCRQILKRARGRVAASEITASPAHEQDHRVATVFLNAAETGQFDQLLELLRDEAALAPAPSDLSQPAPPLVYDRSILFQTLRNTLAQMRSISDDIVVLPIGRDQACVARKGASAKAAILLSIHEEKVAAVRLVKCPALLQELEILMTFVHGGDNPSGTTHHTDLSIRKATEFNRAERIEELLCCFSNAQI
jgi:RNA polymerase sigma-70 factor (ECF subfamily)